MASAFLGQGSDAVIIGVILVASVGLGFANEYKAAKTAEALHSSIHHRCVVRRDGHPRNLDVTGLVPGDVVDLQLGQVVPADLRLLDVAGLECDESVGAIVGSWAAESLVTVSNQGVLWPLGSPRVEGFLRWPHRIPTSPPSAGDPHRNPTDETGLRGTPRHGCYDGPNGG